MVQFLRNLRSKRKNQEDLIDDLIDAELLKNTLINNGVIVEANATAVHGRFKQFKIPFEVKAHPVNPKFTIDEIAEYIAPSVLVKKPHIRFVFKWAGQANFHRTRLYNKRAIYYAYDIINTHKN